MCGGVWVEETAKRGGGGQELCLIRAVRDLGYM